MNQETTTMTSGIDISGHNVGDEIVAGEGAWTFGQGVAETFDNHIARSVPGYSWGHELTIAISKYFAKPKGLMYELGCSTGTLSVRLAEEHRRLGLSVVGIDVEEEMIRHAATLHSNPKLKFELGDITTFPYEVCDFVASHYTLQFLEPSARVEAIGQIYKALRPGGAFILFEKVIEDSGTIQDLLTQLYTDFKLERGFSPLQILSKTRSLKSVLTPSSSIENLERLRAAGFGTVGIIHKSLQFEGYLAIKP